MQCEQPTAIPDQLIKPLKPLKTVDAPTMQELMQTQMHNTRECGVCYVRYKNLVKAVEDRQKVDNQ